jgi:alkylation response protein AidB-like acyl-CoA dehydrogenase
VNTYTAPIDELCFVLNHLTSVEHIASSAGADSLRDPELVEHILRQAAGFAQDVLAPLDTVGDKEGATWTDSVVIMPKGFSSAYRRFVESGWNSVGISGDSGGQGLPILLCTAINEILVSANKAFCTCSELTSASINALSIAGSEYLKNTYMPKLVSGQWTATIDLTEVQTELNLGTLVARAAPNEDDTYQLFGEKTFISYGEHDMAENIVHMVLARLADAPQTSEGVSLFLVPKFLPDTGRRNDVKCVGIANKLGNHGSPSCSVIYGGNDEGARAWLIGEQDKGLSTIMSIVNASRFNAGIEAVALSEKSYQQAKTYAEAHNLNSNAAKPLTSIQTPDVRRMLLLIRSRTEAMRALACVLAEARDLAQTHSDQDKRHQHQKFVDLIVPVFKAWASETGCDNASVAMQILGDMGYIEDSGVPQTYRDQRETTIYEGSTAIQARDFIERQLIKDKGSSYNIWFEQMQDCLARLKQNSTPEFVQIHKQFSHAVWALDDTVNWALKRYTAQPQTVLAGSVLILKLAGLVAGGWQLARSALIADELLDNKEEEEYFLRRKIQTAHFYACHELPEASGLAVVAQEISEPTLALGELAFA